MTITEVPVWPIGVLDKYTFVGSFQVHTPHMRLIYGLYR